MYIWSVLLVYLRMYLNVCVCVHAFVRVCLDIPARHCQCVSVQKHLQHSQIPGFTCISLHLCVFSVVCFVFVCVGGWVRESERGRESNEEGSFCAFRKRLSNCQPGRCNLVGVYIGSSLSPSFPHPLVSSDESREGEWEGGMA